MNPAETSPYPPQPRGCHVTLVELDFARKVEGEVALERLGPAAEEGHYLWLDIDVNDAAQAHEFLTALELLEAPLVDAVLAREADTHLTRFDDYLFVAMTGCRVKGEALVAERVSVVVAAHFMLTVHHGPVRFLEEVRREYRSDFLRFAKGPSFLVYELWDHLTENLTSGQRCLQTRVEKLQAELIGDLDDRTFEQVSVLGSDLLAFRKLLVPIRSVLLELAARKSAFLSDETRPFLASLESTIERILEDVLADRDILSGSLALYMSMVSHRTNEVMKRLTVVSIVFLPLTFLCGVYGMNFRVLPELEWQFGYAYFWGVVAIIVAALLWTLRRARLL